MLMSLKYKTRKQYLLHIFCPLWVLVWERQAVIKEKKIQDLPLGADPPDLAWSQSKISLL